jgi:flagellar biosynthetic protein FliR
VSVAFLVTWLMVFLRSMGVVILVPQMAGHAPPVMVRIGLGVFLATLLAGIVPQAAMPHDYWDLIGSSAGEVLLGLAFGFVAQLAFQTVEFAGHIISSEVGLSVSPGMIGPDMASDPMAAFLTSFAVVLFFASSAHLAVLGAFARSFMIAAPGRPLVNLAAGDMLVVGTAHVIEIGVRIAAPFIALNFLVNLAFSVVGRAVPRMNVFVLSASVRGLAGLALLGGAGALIARYLFVEYSNLPLQLLQILRAG